MKKTAANPMATQDAALLLDLADRELSVALNGLAFSPRWAKQMITGELQSALNKVFAAQRALQNAVPAFGS